MSANNKDWFDFRTIRQNANFASVLSHYGIQAAHGNDGKVLCPFHDDHKPSCSVNMEKKVFQCFSCNSKGNVLDFVQKMEQTDLRSAAAVLNTINENSIALVSSAKPKNNVLTNDVSKENKKLNETLNFELKLETNHPYLAKRGIDASTAEWLGIGVANRGMMKGRVCFPIRARNGELKGYSGRWASDTIPENTPRYLLPKDFNKSVELFGIDNIDKNARVLVITEGFWATMKLQAHNIPAVGLMGTSINRHQAIMIERLQFVDTVFIWLDGDEAGNAALGSVLACMSCFKACITISKHNLDFTHYLATDRTDAEKPIEFADNFKLSLKEKEMLKVIEAYM